MTQSAASHPTRNEQPNTGMLLFGPDGIWELYPPRQHMPVGKLLQGGHTTAMEIRPRPHDNRPRYAQWLGNVVLFSFVIMVFFRLTYPRRFTQFFRAVVSTKGLHSLMREWGPMNVLSVVFSLMHTIGFAIFIYAGSAVLGAPLNFTGNWVIDLSILSAITTFVVYGKYVTIVILAWLFQLRDSGRRYLANQIVFSFIFSLMLFPILLSIIYNPSVPALLTSAALLALLHVFRLLRSFAIGLSERHIPLLYLFLYLCTLEIVPLVLLFKAVSIVVSGQGFA